MSSGRSAASARRVRTTGLAAALALLLVGCAVGPVGNGPLPAGVEAELVQLRSDVAARQAQVRVYNSTADPLVVGTVAVVDQRFDGEATRALDRPETTVPAGGTVDIRVQLPPMACDAGDGEMTVLLEVDGESVEGPLPDALGAIGPLYERECLAQRVAESADLSLADFEPSPPGEPASLRLEITPTGEGDARLRGILSTNLLTFAAPDAGADDGTVEVLPLDVDLSGPGAEATVVALPIVPIRCDPHAVQEDKRGTVFNLDVDLAGESGIVQLAASEEMRGRILTWVGEWCRFGE